MAAYARGRGYRGTVLEEAGRTTWENVTNVVPLLEDADRIKIVSDPFHALKARTYLVRQRPDLTSRLVSSADYRPGEWFVLKPIVAALVAGLFTAHGRGKRGR
jgi:uncharacterized SAM-binding protein YcdF (DUF218 family)